MSKNLFIELLNFSLSRKTTSRRLKYILFAMLFYYPLSKSLSSTDKDESASPSQAGDDIYPLF